MRKPLSSTAVAIAAVAVRETEDLRRDPPLQPAEIATRRPAPPRAPADRIKDALLRWLEEELP